jgi:hypothetical protein
MPGNRSRREKERAGKIDKGGLTASEEACRRVENEAEEQSEGGKQRTAADKG